MKKLILTITFISAVFFSFGQVPTSERDALMAIYNSTGGPNWVNNMNWGTTNPVSSWHGISVANIDEQDHVVAIELASNNLNGTLPIEIGDFEQLTVISITFNELLTGNIPGEIGNLPNLEILDFWNNNLTGTIPSGIGNCTNLTLLTFEDNSLTGNIPESFVNFSSMTSFWLNGNQLSGEIPDIFSSWLELVYFSIGDFNLTGSNNNFSGELDFSMNSAMRGCMIEGNNISSLNIQNGNNSNIPNSFFQAGGNTNLICVFVDDAVYSSTNWTNIDETATFVETQAECDAITVGVDELNFESNLTIYPNPTTGIINFINNGETAIKEIIITNSLGQVIDETNENNTLNISNFSSGIYLIRIQDINGNRANYKIVKE